ncbi:MAG: hypothetical protein K0S51_2665 [Bacillales bacterium]|jgi:type II secretory pathway component GspD/PulD (secretin)|nr:hypothetical protein [Bacillales bacterium]
MESLELLAYEILKQCETVSLGSVTENGYPYICPMEKVMSNQLRQIYFITLKSSKKVKNFLKDSKAGVNYYIDDDTISLNGIINIIEDVESEVVSLPTEYLERIRKRGSLKYCILEFVTMEAKMFISGRFEIVSYNK